jgi:hypothetical protein
MSVLVTLGIGPGRAEHSGGAGTLIKAGTRLLAWFNTLSSLSTTNSNGVVVSPAEGGVAMGRASRIKLTFSGVLIAFGILASALPKQWIEEVVGFEPDSGNGAVEFALAVVPLAVGAALAVSVFLSERRERAAERSPD